MAGAAITGWGRFALVLLLMSLLSAGVASAQSTGELDVEITVLPPGSIPPVPGEQPATGEEGADPVPPRPGTVSARLSSAHPVRSGGDLDTTALNLVVADDRGTVAGWSVHLSGDFVSDPLWLDRYLHRTELLYGQPVDPTGPRGTRLSVGQPLDRTTPVIEAEPGTGMGAYWIRFAMSGDPDLAAASLIITLTTAP